MNYLIQILGAFPNYAQSIFQVFMLAVVYILQGAFFALFFAVIRKFFLNKKALVELSFFVWASVFGCLIFVVDTLPSYFGLFWFVFGLIGVGCFFRLWEFKLNLSISKIVYSPYFLLIVCCLIFLIWACYPFVLNQLGEMEIGSSTPLQAQAPEAQTQASSSFGDKFGTFGDSFGALNTLFAGCAFAGIVVSIFMQSKELKDTREELKGQREEQGKQNIQLKTQAFESMFLTLVSQKREVTNDLKFDEQLLKRISGDGRHNYVWRTVFNHEREDMLNICSEEVGKDCVRLYVLFYGFFCGSEYYGCMANWDKFYGSYMQDRFSSYLRICYQVLKLIDNSGFLEDSFFSDAEAVVAYKSKKKFYADIFRAQFSSAELQLLFFNCLGTVGRRNFKEMAEKYGLFEHLPFDAFNTVTYDDQGKVTLGKNSRDEHLLACKCVRYAYLYDKKAFEDNEKWKEYFDEVFSEDQYVAELARKKYEINEAEFKNFIATRDSK